MKIDLFQEHREIIAAAEDLLGTLRRVPRAPLEEITQRRVRLGNLAAAHLRSEDEVIMRPLHASGRIDELPGAQAMFTEIRAGHSVYSAHVRKWTLAAIEQDRRGYADAVVGMIAYLRDMTAREENILYWPALRLLGQLEQDDNGSITRQAG